MNTLDPNTLSPSDIIRWMDIAVRVDRQALGIPSEISRMEHTATGGGPIEIQLEQKSEENRKLSDEELLKELLHVTHACITWGRDTNRLSYAKANALYTLLDQIERDQPLDFDPSLKEAIGQEYEWRLVRKEPPVLQ